MTHDVAVFVVGAFLLITLGVMAALADFLSGE